MLTYYSTCMLGRSCNCILYRCTHANARACKIVNIHIYVCRKQTWFYISLYSGSRTCLVDGQDLTMTKINPDNHCIRELMALECICPNQQRGCPWTDVVELLRVIMIMRHNMNILLVIMSLIEDAALIWIQYNIITRASVGFKT